MSMPETWKVAPGCGDCYEVSDLGRIRSLDRMVNTHPWPRKRRVRGRILKDKLNQGYPTATISLGVVRFPIAVHILVARAFIPNPHGLPEVNHIDGKRANNRIENLEWVTSSGNRLHAAHILLSFSGEKNGRSKLSTANVIDIRLLHSQGISVAELSRRFGVAHSSVSDIVNGKKWTHVPAELTALRAQGDKL